VAVVTDATFWNAALLCAGGVVYVAGCMVPNRWLPARMPNDKLLHFVAFAVLGWLTLALAGGPERGILWLPGLVLAGVVVEWMQQLVPDRGFSWRDIAANVAGVAFAAAVALATTSFQE
jgi:uncharacterized protein YfiM (DUF2279 family)